MLTKTHVMPLLLAACPGFEPMWREHREWWGTEEAGIYNDTSEFARYIVESFDRGDTTEFQAAFGAIERLLREGDEEARSAASIGALEAIQVQSSHYSFGSDAFSPWLGPLSADAWDQIDALWAAGGGSLAGVVRLERRLQQETQHPNRWWQFWRR